MLCRSSVARAGKGSYQNSFRGIILDVICKLDVQNHKTSVRDLILGTFSRSKVDKLGSGEHADDASPATHLTLRQMGVDEFTTLPLALTQYTISQRKGHRQL